MYEKFLNRTPDAGGLENWYNQLVSNTLEGANIIDGFVTSEEFRSKDLTAEEYLNIMYNGIFDRNPDAVGFKNWSEVYTSGVSDRYIPAQFVGSVEFKELCKKFGISQGQIKLTESRDQNLAVTQFVNHFYQHCLNRSGDESGLNDWTGSLLNKVLTGSDIANGFILSKEYQNKNLTDEQFIETLYNTLLSRTSDPGGMADWLNRADSGVSDNYMIAQFVYSKEFEGLCKKYGILRGDIELKEFRDQKWELTDLVTYLFQSVLERDATIDDLNHWTGSLITRNITSEELAEALFLSEEYALKNATNTKFIKTLYESLLRRPASDAEITNQLSVLKKANGNRTSVLDIIAGSTEYHKYSFLAGASPIVNGWYTFEDDVYHFANRIPTTGWYKENGNRFYLNPSNNGAREANGWAYVDGYKLYFDHNGVLDQDVEDIIGPQDEYMIKVYKWGNYLTIFAKDGDNGFIIPVKAFITSCGNATPTGYYRTPWKSRWCTMVGGSQAQWVTQITGDFLFHSVPYAVQNNTSLYVDSMYNHLGSTRSMGCIRLEAGNAKWIYDNCKLGTLVHIDPNVNSGPFDKPSFSPVPSWHTWDPTDPTAHHLCQQRGCH